MKRIIVVKLIAGSLFFLAFIIGIHRFVYELEDNKCEMTYMFEYPQYIKVKLGDNVSNLFPHYKLFVYGEGELAEKYHKSKFKGIPVLFIPGNAGSYKQVRSVASVAYRKSLDLRKHFHFDFFTLDFNEQLSAFYGGILDLQTDFARICINKILSLYKPHSKTLVLIGHSMGGMVARAVFSDKDFSISSISSIITLATPHSNPVITIDEDISEFYDRVNNLWLETNNVIERVPLASIGGADRDVQVRSGLTIANSAAINVLTTEIPTVWLATDHLCIVWCKQVVLPVVRSLFDMVNTSTHNWIDQIELKKEILSYHFLKGNGVKTFQNSQSTREIDFDPNGTWREVVAPRFTANLGTDAKINTYFMVPLIHNAFRDRLVAVASGLPIKYWVFGCVALEWRNSVSERGVDLSDQTVLLPNIGDHVKRKFVYLDLSTLSEKGFTHIVFNIPKNYPKGSVLLDVHRSSIRNLEVKFPFTTYIPFAFVDRIVIPSDSLSFNITLPNFYRSWQSITAKPIQSTCSSESNALVRKVVPWSHESQFFLTNHTFPIHLHVPKTPANSEYESAHLQFINPNPDCNYEIAISVDWIGMWAQLARFYTPFLLPLLFTILLHCLSMQLREKQAKHLVPSTLSCLCKMPVFKLALIPEVFSIVLRVIDSLHPPFMWSTFSTDEFLLRDEGLGFPMMYLLLGAVAWIFAIILTVVFWLGISLGGHTLHTLIIRYLRGTFGFTLIVAELVAVGLSRIPIVISVALVAIAASTCGSLALILGLGVAIWKLFSYYEDELESIISDEDNHEVEDDFHISTTISLLWFCTAILNLPVLVIWSTSPNFILPNDYTLLPSFAWSVFGILALHNKSVCKSSTVYKHLANLISVLSLLMLMYGLVSIYRVQYFVTAAVTAYALAKYFAE